jgi:hypothetical protein
MENFVHRENLRHLREVLKQANDEVQRRQVLKLLAEEEAVDVKRRSELSGNSA